MQTLCSNWLLPCLLWRMGMMGLPGDKGLRPRQGFRSCRRLLFLPEPGKEEGSRPDGDVAPNRPERHVPEPKLQSPIEQPVEHPVHQPLSHGGADAGTAPESEWKELARPVGAADRPIRRELLGVGMHRWVVMDAVDEGVHHRGLTISARRRDVGENPNRFLETVLSDPARQDLDRRLEFRLSDASFRPIRRNVTIWPGGFLFARIRREEEPSA